MDQGMRKAAAGLALALFAAVRPASALKLPALDAISVSFDGSNGLAAAPAASAVADAAAGDAVFPTYYVKNDGAEVYTKKPEAGEERGPLLMTQLYKDEPVRQLAFTKDGWSLVEVDRLTEYNEKTGKWESSKGWVRTDCLSGDAAAGAQWQVTRVWYGPGPGGGPVPQAMPQPANPQAPEAMPSPSEPQAQGLASARPASDEPPKGLLDAFIKSLLSFQGTPYKWGGTSPGRDGGVDCSGLIVASLTKIGFGRIPRTAADQQRATGAQRLTDPRELKPGDLLFVGSPAHHVLAYIGNGQVIEAPHTGDIVHVTPLDQRFASLGQLTYGTILP